MDFRNRENKFDFTELPSAYGDMGSYGTNHLTDEFHKGFAQGMTYILREVRNRMENDYDERGTDENLSIREKIFNETAREVLEDVLDGLCGDIAIMVVSMGDEEYDKEEKEQADVGINEDGEVPAEAVRSGGDGSAEALS